MVNDSNDDAFKSLILKELISVTASFDTISTAIEKYFTYSNDKPIVKQKTATEFGVLNAEMPVSICEQYFSMPINEYTVGYKNILTQYLKKKPSASISMLTKYMSDDTPDEEDAVMDIIVGSISQISYTELNNLLMSQQNMSKRNKVILRILDKVPDVRKYSGEIIVGNSRLKCNLLQSILVTSEDDDESKKIFDKLVSRKCDTKDKVIYAGKKMKWSDFLTISPISDDTRKLCIRY